MAICTAFWEKRATQLLWRIVRSCEDFHTMHRSPSTCSLSDSCSYEEDNESVKKIDPSFQKLNQLSSENGDQHLLPREEKDDITFEFSLATISSDVCYQLVQINMKYLQKYSVTSDVMSTSDVVLDHQGKNFMPEFQFGVYPVEYAAGEGRTKRARSRRFPKPYCVPGRLYQSDLLGEEPTEGEEPKAK